MPNPLDPGGVCFALFKVPDMSRYILRPFTLSEALLDAEVRLGDLLKQIPKVSGGDRRSNNFKKDTAVQFEKPKKEVIQDLGFSPKQAQRFETLANSTK